MSTPAGAGHGATEVIADLPGPMGQPWPIAGTKATVTWLSPQALDQLPASDADRIRAMVRGSLIDEPAKGQRGRPNTESEAHWLAVVLASLAVSWTLDEPLPRLADRGPDPYRGLDRAGERLDQLPLSTREGLSESARYAVRATRAHFGMLLPQEYASAAARYFKYDSAQGDLELEATCRSLTRILGWQPSPRDVRTVSLHLYAAVTGGGLDKVLACPPGRAVNIAERMLKADSANRAASYFNRRITVERAELTWALLARAGDLLDRTTGQRDQWADKAAARTDLAEILKATVASAATSAVASVVTRLDTLQAPRRVPGDTIRIRDGRVVE